MNPGSAAHRHTPRRERRALSARLLCITLLAGLGAPAPAAAQPPAARTAWGDPDLRGLWNHGTATPLERPRRHAGRDRLTADEVAAINAEARSAAGDLARRAVWWERGLSDGRTAMIVDPPDGRIPYTEAARSRDRPRPHVDGPEGRNLWERCITSGVPRLGGAYLQNIHLLQTPDHVVLLHEMIHEVRIVPLDGRPHLPGHVRQWLGDARGRWEGDTLVVETTNFHGSQVFRGLSQGTTRLIERFTPVAADTLRYEVTFDDPLLWTRPWTASLPLARTVGPMFEYACHEGNVGMTNTLRDCPWRGARAGTAVIADRKVADGQEISLSRAPAGV